MLDGVWMVEFRAPELHGGKYVDQTATSNIWALGCVLLEMYTRTSWPLGVLIAKLHDRPADDGLPESLAAVILQCLQPRPEDRPTANEVAQVRVHSA